LKAAVQVSSRMSVGRAFRADGPENENALSPNFVRTRGTSNRPLTCLASPKMVHLHWRQIVK